MLKVSYFDRLMSVVRPSLRQSVSSPSIISSNNSETTLSVLIKLALNDLCMVIFKIYSKKLNPPELWVAWQPKGKSLKIFFSKTVWPSFAIWYVARACGPPP